MEKSKRYQYALFPAEVLREALNKYFPNGNEDKDQRCSYRLSNATETWDYDDEEEFFADYRKSHIDSSIRKSNNSKSLNVRYSNYYGGSTVVSVEGKKRSDIESVFEIFEKNYKNSMIEPRVEDKLNKIVIFIGHGHSTQWRDLKDHLSDKHGFKIEAYETGARAGHTIRDILDDMSSKSSFALLVMTGEDEDKDGKLRARQNVIHEIGLFQGRLGFNRAIILLEKDTDEFSNLQGIDQIRFSKNNIKETFGEILAIIKREFK